MTWRFFRFCDHYDIAINEKGITSSLLQEIGSLEVKQSQKPIFELTLCAKRLEIPATGFHVLQGKYKGIPWVIASKISSGIESNQVYFHAPLFSTFLVLRQVLIPILKKEISKDGGFSFIGTSFQNGPYRYILFGFPGCGKTRRLLEAIQTGAKFIGDSEIAVTREGEIKGLFKYLEFRYDTVHRTPYWPKLSEQQKLQLFLYRCISVVTQKSVSFNVLVHPKDLGIISGSNQAGSSIVFVHLGGNSKKERASISDIMKGVEDYEKNYRVLFGDTFFNRQDFSITIAVMSQFLPKCSLWKMPVNSSIKDILSLR